MLSPAVYIETFGCQMNEYDTLLVRSILKSGGYRFTDCSDTADIVLLNTCAIRENAHNKVYGHLGELKHLKHQKGVIIGVLGCMAQNLKKDLLAADSIIDVLAGPDSYRLLPELLRNAGKGHKQSAVDLSEYETYSDIAPDQVPGITAWIAVMRGCDNFCTFCVVPYTRGRERSREFNDVVGEAEALAANGCKQITLLGQNVNSYRDEKHDFADLLRAVADVGGIERVRFMSPHPKDFPEKLLEVVCGHPRVSKHIHLPLQSGSDRILELMGRSYTQKEYRALVSRIRALCPDITLTTDIIVGFCSETQAEYQETYDLFQKMEYELAYIFKYSERKHTIAARKFKDDVPEEVKSERVTAIIELQRGVSLKKNQAMIGRTVQVLIEGDGKRSSQQWLGRTDGGTVTIFPKTDPSVKPGCLAPVIITDATVTTLYAEPLEQPLSLS